MSKSIVRPILIASAWEKNNIMTNDKAHYHIGAHEAKPIKGKLDPLVVRAAIVLVIGSLAPLLDSTMVNVAIKSITTDFKSTVSVIQWLITGYVLAMGISIPISGWANNCLGEANLHVFFAHIFGRLCAACPVMGI